MFSIYHSLLLLLSLSSTLALQEQQEPRNASPASGSAQLGIAPPSLKRGIEYSSLSSMSLKKRASGYSDPATNGGLMLTIVNGTYPAGLGEPLNMIISAESDKEVLVNSQDNGGFLNYMLSTMLAGSCLGQNLGTAQQANLGDGKGAVDEINVLRWDFGDPYLGSCKETFSGGLHLRYWIQNTTGAYFMAVSEEKDLASGHDIQPNGYNDGRDWLVGNITNQTSVIPQRNVTNTSTFLGETVFANYTYQSSVSYVSGLLQNSSTGINHYITVESNGYPAIDGLVAVVTVKIVARPASSFGLPELRKISIPLLLVGITTAAGWSLL